MLSAQLAVFGALAAVALQGCGRNPGNPSGPTPPNPTPAPTSAPGPAPDFRSPLRAGAFQRYYDYMGPLDVSGTVDIGEVDASVQTVFVNLKNVDAKCTGTQNGAGNVCGIHIHSGTSCSEDAGGHYYQGGDDPWVPVTYSGSGNGEAIVSDTVVSTGYSLAELSGKVFVVHDIAGARIACAVLDQVLKQDSFDDSFTQSVQTWTVYPGYTGGLQVGGRVDIATKENAQIMNFDLTNTDPSCSVGADVSVPNACGIHIHSGTSCESAGGHYYNPSTVSLDPWVHITYRGKESSSTGTTIAVHTGYSEGKMKGKVVVVHDVTGQRVACGVIETGSSVVGASLVAV